MKYSFLLFACVFAGTVRAQWVQTNGPFGDPVSSLAVRDSTLYAGTFGGVYGSTDRGTTWVRENSGLDTPVETLTLNGNNLFAGTYGGGAFQLAKGDANWESVSDGLTDVYLTSLAAIGGNLYAGTQGTGSGVFRSTNNGLTWQLTSDGLYNVGAFAGVSTDLYCGTGSWILSGRGVFRSFDTGSTWTWRSSGLGNSSIAALAVLQNYVFACAYNDNGVGSIFRSSDKGINWYPIGTGLSDSTGQCLYVYGSAIFLGTANGGIFYSSNDGAAWSSVSNGLSDLNIRAIIALGTDLYVGTFSSGVWRRPLSDFGISSVAQSLADNEELWTYPNPLSQSTTVSFMPQSTGFADISIVNQLGIEVAHLFSGELTAGEHEFHWEPTGGLPNGMYECLVRMNGRVEKAPAVLLR